MHQLPQALALARILNRTALVAVHRRQRCDGVFVNFTRDALVMAVEDNPVDVVRKHAHGACAAVTRHKWTPTRHTGLECDDVGAFRNVRILELGAWVDDLTLLVRNKHLSPEERLRAKHLLSMGRYAYGGMLLHEVADVSRRVTDEFETSRGEYAATATRNHEVLRDPHVFRVGLHVRHLPFIARETGAAVMDRRALRCVLDVFLDPEDVARIREGGFTKCAVLLSTDTAESRAALPGLVKEVVRVPATSNLPFSSCEVFQVSPATSNTNTSSSYWGKISTNDGESRSREDRRGVLEAYLDLYVLSQYAHTLVVGLGSTFAQLLATRGAGRGSMVVREYASFSCKDGGYFPYPCCMARRSGRDRFVGYVAGAGDDVCGGGGGGGDGVYPSATAAGE